MLNRILQILTVVMLSVVGAGSAYADPVPGNACSTANQVMQSGGPENSGNAYWMVCQGGTWRQIFSSDANGMASTNTPTAAGHVATKGYVDSMASGGGGGFAVFTASGNWTVPAGVTYVAVTVAGGGGGGSGATSDIDGPSAGPYANIIYPNGCGGFQGLRYESSRFPVTPGAVIPVVVGAGGAGQPPIAGNTVPYFRYASSNGQDSTFGGFVRAQGGAGAYYGYNYHNGSEWMVNGCVGWSGVSTQEGAQGNTPNYFFYYDTPNLNNHYYYGGGGGAPSIFGSGGNGGNPPASFGGNGTNGGNATGFTGGGGGGGSGHANNTSGGNGAPGFVIIRWGS